MKAKSECESRVTMATILGLEIRASLTMRTTLTCNCLPQIYCSLHATRIFLPCLALLTSQATRSNPKSLSFRRVDCAELSDDPCELQRSVVHCNVADVYLQSMCTAL